VISEIVFQAVSMLMPTFNTNVGFPFYGSLSPQSFDSGNVGVHLRG